MGGGGVTLLIRIEHVRAAISSWLQGIKSLFGPAPPQALPWVKEETRRRRRREYGNRFFQVAARKNYTTTYVRGSECYIDDSG